MLYNFIYLRGVILQFTTVYRLHYVSYFQKSRDSLIIYLFLYHDRMKKYKYKHYGTEMEEVNTHLTSF